MDAPVLIGYDGSLTAAHALRSARALVATNSVIIVTVWESALADPMLIGPGDLTGSPMLDPETAHVLDTAETEQARRIADHGVELATSLGFAAEGVAVPDESNVAETLIRLAQQRGAAAIVIGSRGRGPLRSLVLGSTGGSLMRHARCPVLVVPPPDQE